MSRRPALVTQADVARAIRAAKQVGGLFEVEVRGASILIRPTCTPSTVADKPLEPERDIVL